jgi:hypothetical protein
MHERKAYTIFDLLGEFGGLQAVSLIFLVFMTDSYASFSLDLKLISSLFEFKDSTQAKAGHKGSILKLSDSQKVGLFFASVCPCASKKNSRLKALKMGQERLETVMSLICIVDKLREIKGAGIDFSRVIDLDGNGNGMVDKETAVHNEQAMQSELKSMPTSLNYDPGTFLMTAGTPGVQKGLNEALLSDNNGRPG